MSAGSHTPPAWALVTFITPDHDGDRAGILLDDGRIVIPDPLAGYSGLAGALRDWDRLAPALRAATVETLPGLPSARLVAPVRYPNKLFIVGANYVDHLEEMGAIDFPKTLQPFIFFVPPSTTLIGPDEPVLIPADPAAKVDWEAELAIVIGKTARDVAPEHALDYVAGYAAFNDITARGYARREQALGPPFQFDWARSKGLDTFCPMGPITPAWMFGDPQAVGIRCTVNGALRQDGNSRSMIIGVREIVAMASRNWTLEPGDVIATGTPAGVGVVKGTFLNDGDEILVEVEGCAALRNRVAVRGVS